MLRISRLTGGHTGAEDIRWSVGRRQSLVWKQAELMWFYRGELLRLHAWLPRVACCVYDKWILFSIFLVKLIVLINTSSPPSTWSTTQSKKLITRIFTRLALQSLSLTDVFFSSVIAWLQCLVQQKWQENWGKVCKKKILEFFIIGVLTHPPPLMDNLFFPKNVVLWKFY